MASNQFSSLFFRSDQHLPPDEFSEITHFQRIHFSAAWSKLHSPPPLPLAKYISSQFAVRSTRGYDFNQSLSESDHFCSCCSNPLQENQASQAKYKKSTKMSPTLDKNIFFATSLEQKTCNDRQERWYEDSTYRYIAIWQQEYFRGGQTSLNLI